MLKLKVRHMNSANTRLTESEFEKKLQLNYVTDGKGYVDYATIVFPSDIEVTIMPNGINKSKERFKVVRKVKHV